MSNFIKNLFESKERIPLEKIIFSLFAIIFIRIFLEIFSSPSPVGYLIPYEGMFLHIPLYYFSTFFSFAILLYLITKDPIYKIVAFLTKVFILMWLAPIADLLATHGQGSQISFITTEAGNIPMLFLKLMDPRGYSGVTLGLHVASYALIASFAIYIYKRTNSLLKVFLGMFFSYIILFLYAIIPSLISLPYTLSNSFLPAKIIFNNILNQSWISLTQEKSAAGLDTFNQQLFLNNIFVAHIFFILVIVQFLIIIFVSEKRIWNCLKKSLRPTRVFNYMLLACVGILIARSLTGDLNLGNPANMISLATFFILIILNSLLAVFINDEEDIKIDEISNPDRPLVKKEVTLDEWKKIKTVIFLLLVFGTATLNEAAAFFLILAQAVYYLYSARPLRFKRNFVSASLAIGFATAFVAMSGFFLVSPDQHVLFFPFEAMLIIGISQALIQNMKDLKDIEGDGKEGIMTLPVILGFDRSKKVIALLYGLVFLGIVAVLGVSSMIVSAFLCSLLVFYFFTKKKYQERPIFMVLFAYMFLLFLFLVVF